VKVWPFVVAALLLAYLAWRFKRESNQRRILIGVVVVLLCVYGSGVVELPNIEKLIEDVGRTLGKWTYLLVGGLAFLETGAFIGLIAPGETAIMLGGVVAGQGEISLVLLIGIVWFAAVAGDTTSYLLGRRLGRGFLERHGPKVKITEERLQWVEGFFERRGGATILIGRFVGLARALAPFIAGASKMSYRKFLPYDVIGAGLWGATFCILGYVFWRSFSRLLEIAKQGALALATVIVVVVGAIAAYRFLRVPANREKTRRWIDEQAGRPAVRPVVRALRPVYRRGLLPAWRGVAGPLRFLWHRLTPGELGLELTTVLAVALVGGATFVGQLMLLEDRSFLGVDRTAFDAAGEARSGVLVDVADVLSALGGAPVVASVVAATLAFLVVRRAFIGAAMLLVASLLTFFGVLVTKALEDRPRPLGALVDTDGSSYPSAHAAFAVAYVAVAVAIARGFPGWAGRVTVGVVAVALAVLIGLARVYLRANYLSDVLGGWGLGTAIFALCGGVALVVGFLRHNGSER